MAQVNIVVLKRNYTRSRNILVELERKAIEFQNLPTLEFEEKIVSIEVFVSNLKTKSEVFIHNRNLLEQHIENEAELEALVTEEHETFFTKVSLLVLELESKIKEFQCKKSRQQEIAQEQDERLLREYTSEREEREHRLVMEELDLRRLEIQRLPASASGNNQSHSTLPKINLLTFSGELEKYQEFSDNFMSLIDSRTDLANNVKLHYLKGQLTGKAALLVEGLRITNDNYKVALDILKEEFGTPHMINNKIYHDLETLYLQSNRPESIEEFYRKIELNIKLLENQGVDIGNNQLLSSLLFRKIPSKAQEKLVTDHGAVITVRHIRSYIQSELHKQRVLESLNPSTVSKVKEPSRENFIQYKVPKVSGFKPRFTTESMVTVRKSSDKKECVFCQEDHYEDQCSKYKTAEDRRQKLGKKCYICLGSGHLARFCNLNYKCYHCSKFKIHHRSLCPSKYSGSKNWEHARNKTEFGPVSKFAPATSKRAESSTSENISAKNDKVTKSGISAITSCAMNTVVYMQTAVLHVKDKNSNKTVPVRAILDTASSNSYVSERLQKLLGLETGKAVHMNVYTFGALEPKRFKTPEVCLDVITSEAKYNLRLFVVPNIVCSDNKRNYNQEFLQKLNENYTLADTCLLDNPNQDYDILLGVDYYANFFLPEKIQVNDNLFLYNTVFGHVLSGTIAGDQILADEQDLACSSLFTKTEFCVDPTDNMNKLWDLHTIGIKENSSISDDDLALQSFETTLEYKDSRYYVDFPWKNDTREVQSNYGLAVGRLKSLIKRHTDDGILKVCETTLGEQLENGILEEVPEKDLEKNACYFPYHAIIKKDNHSTTKVRFVMDASARQNRSKPSLNDLLYRGPVLLENLCALLLRFRLPKYALIADIEKAFLNIGLNESERDYTRILWLKDVTKPICPDNILVLRHARLPFGVVSSPFLLSCVIRTHLDKYPDNPVVDQLRHNIYMDNILCGVDCESDIAEFVSTARRVFLDASLNLREWSSNHSINLGPECINSNRVQNTLGMLWDTQEDTLCLKFHFEYETNVVICKRLLLSVLASFFDILGLWTPIIMPLKLLVQSAWIQKKDWDDELETHDKSEFLRMVDSMNYVKSMPVLRHLDISSNDTLYELHSFSDACTYSYASVVYLRSVSASGKITSNLVFAKSRLAPTINKPSLPRLELLGSLIAYRSLKFVREALQLKISKCYLWSDNQCVLHWLTGNKVLPIFINNRVKEIKSASFPITYRYIPTESNPADIACRGSSAMNLVDNVLWWKGPAFLSTNTVPDYNFPSLPIVDEEVTENQSSELNLVVNSDENDKCVSPLNIDERKYNSFKKLVNVTCYVKKFINLCRRRPEFKGPISLDEYKDGKTEWLKYTQAKYFSSTIQSLSQGKSDQISLQLGLELDHDGLLICKGRFRELEYEGKKLFPVLLPRNCHLTDIIVTDVHRSCFHNGTSQTLATLRLEYWITQGRSEVKKILRNCVNCKKFRQGPYKQPEFCFYPNYRVQRNVAFQYSSVDMFGPLTVQEGKKLVSVHGLIFVCMTTRAIHIEILDSENTTDFLLAFKRFISRRNVCKQILSDNAIQFKLLSQVFNMVHNNDVSSYLNQKGVKFTFTSPLSPWEGGLYERLIGSTKQCLRKTLGHLLLSKTQLNTVLIEIENVINSRPLGYVSEEEMMITPNHFLGIKSDSLGPEQFDYDSRGKSVTFKKLIGLWKKGSSYLDMFWKTWVKQYLNALRERKQITFKQGRTSKLEPRIGEVVLIKDSNLTRFNWPYGTIAKLNRGKDNKIRNVDVRTTSGRIITRSISMLYPLEI